MMTSQKAGGSRALLSCLAMAAVLLAIYVESAIHPFIATADGLKRIDQATGTTASAFTVLPPLQSLLLQGSVSATGGLGLYTLIQIAAFYLATLVSYASLLSLAPRAALVLISIGTVLLPVFLVFPGILTDSAFVFCCMACIPTLILHAQKSTSAVKPGHLALLTLLLTLLFGMRLNSVIAAPAIILMAFIYAKNFWRQALVAVAISLLLVGAVNRDFRQQARPEALGMAWEIVGTASLTHQADPSMASILDFCGDTQAAIGRFNTRYLNAIFWDSKPPLPVSCIASPKGNSEVISAYIQTITAHPMAWLTIKAKMWAGVYGLSKPLEGIRRGIHDVDEPTVHWGGQHSESQQAMRQLFFTTADGLGPLLYRPAFNTALACLATGLVFVWFKAAFPAFIALLVIGNSYYLGFLISAQSMEFRYFAPTFYINIMIIAAALTLACTRRTKHVAQRVTSQ